MELKERERKKERSNERGEMRNGRGKRQRNLRKRR